jgi:hypothetical protein
MRRESNLPSCIGHSPISETTSEARAKTRLLTGLPLRYYSEPEPLQVENYKMSATLIFTSRGLFIGVQGGVTDLMMSVTCISGGQPA